jgi:hypothetical protein
MPLERGSILMPNQKPMLITEVQEELLKVNDAIRNKGIVGGSTDLLIETKKRLENILQELSNMKGVVTPSKVDDVLDAIDEAKKSRLQTDYYMGLRKSTLYLISFIAIGYGIYYFSKKYVK